MSHLGKIAYTEYVCAAGGKSLVSGEPLPEYDDLGEPVKAAWKAAAMAVEASVRGLDGATLVLSGLTLDAIQAEATRARLRHGEHSMMGSAVTESDRLAILAEEVGEVARELNEDRLGNIDPEQWRERRVKELIQVAAMAASWVEYLEGGQS